MKASQVKQRSLYELMEIQRLLAGWAFANVEGGPARGAKSSAGVSGLGEKAASQMPDALSALCNPTGPTGVFERKALTDFPMISAYLGCLADAKPFWFALQASGGIRLNEKTLKYELSFLTFDYLWKMGRDTVNAARNKYAAMLNALLNTDHTIPSGGDTIMDLVLKVRRLVWVEERSESSKNAKEEAELDEALQADGSAPREPPEDYMPKYFIFFVVFGLPSTFAPFEDPVLSAVAGDASTADALAVGRQELRATDKQKNHESKTVGVIGALTTALREATSSSSMTSRDMHALRGTEIELETVKVAIVSKQQRMEGYSKMMSDTMTDPLMRQQLMARWMALDVEVAELEALLLNIKAEVARESSTTTRSSIASGTVTPTHMSVTSGTVTPTHYLSSTYSSSTYSSSRAEDETGAHEEVTMAEGVSSVKRARTVTGNGRGRTKKTPAEKRLAANARMKASRAKKKVEKQVEGAKTMDDSSSDSDGDSESGNEGGNIQPGGLAFV